MTSVVGAAGYGKTTAVAAWAASSMVEVAWYSIDASDDAPAVFWRNLTEAIGRVIPLEGIDDVGSNDSPRAVSDADGLLDTLGDDPADLIVVIDDLHLIAGPAILDDLTRLVERAPGRMRFVLIARSHSRLPWGRWAVRELLAEVSERDLAMDRMEAATVVRAAAGDSAAHSAVDRAIDV
ncbi:MAG: hypothetical protein FGM58_09470, partial [Acidimicrobiia bacterium]|nr:hypothetical protein [Acidimicrobiia bacterium]